MSSIALTTDLNRRFEYAKAFLDAAKLSGSNDAIQTNIEASVTLAFSFLEGALTYIFEHFDNNEKFNVFERSIMLEKDLKLKDGEPKMESTKYRSIEDRIQFIFWLFTGKPFDKTQQWWPKISSAITYRNSIMHPKRPTSIQVSEAERHLISILEATDALFRVVFGKGWPRAKKGLYTKVSISEP